LISSAEVLIFKVGLQFGRAGLLSLRTLAITWPQGVISEDVTLAEAAQVNGGVRWLLKP
jgi:hypothetical protein